MTADMDTQTFVLRIVNKVLAEIRSIIAPFYKIQSQIESMHTEIEAERDQKSSSHLDMQPSVRAAALSRCGGRSVSPRFRPRQVGPRPSQAWQVWAATEPISSARNPCCLRESGLRHGLKLAQVLSSVRRTTLLRSQLHCLCARWPERSQGSSGQFDSRRNCQLRAIDLALAGDGAGQGRCARPVGGQFCRLSDTALVF
jgi:hypothetical protein